MKPFYPLPQEIPLLLEEVQRALVRPLRQQPRGIIKQVLQNGNRKDIYLLVDAGNWDNNVCESTPFDQPGTILWCRETFSGFKQIGGRYVREKLHFKATEPELPGARWLLPVTMPIYVSRLWLEVLELKVCRLMDLTHEEMYETGVRIADSYSRGMATDEGSVEAFNCGDGIRRVFYEIYDERFGKREISNPWIWYAAVKKVDSPV
ncbi:MAG: hypothetical protein J7619_07510 [Dyadobacter sp.]|uniref:hypothetical protein n=1 Tax=Dyadobacter sp. TaxID=1914288 RepID=UPI001AFDF343|nr:hypothetical protein [Dyadobacter sp.]MBO9612524.1 hypothetical protein [Dyadobacter sp.]